MVRRLRAAGRLAPPPSRRRLSHATGSARRSHDGGMLRSDVLHALGHGALMAVILIAVSVLMHAFDGVRDVVLALVVGVVAVAADLVRRRRARRRTRVPDSRP